MQQQFVETIKIANGKPSNLPYHQARMERTIRHFFPNLALRSMPCLEKLIVASDDMALVKARVVYGADGVELIEYAPYSMRTISSLQVVCDDTISYSYKSCDRSQLNALAAKKGDCDEIIIVKNNLVTDTSFTNLAISDGNCSISISALRYQMIVFPACSFMMMANMMMQTCRKTIRANILAASRQGLFFIPLIIILPHYFGLFGVEICQAVSDLISFLVTIPIVWTAFREISTER